MHGRQPGQVDPARLGVGTQVGSWRVLGPHEAGTYGVVYLAVHAGDEAAGPCALKLARRPGDARLAREVELLARVHHPNVPRLLGHGDWDGFPYLVMEWVAGVELYRWARLGNPSRRQVARLLAKLAGALAVLHAVDGVHRDLKGDNVLVRLSDGEPLLTDFGAGTWEGAAPLTVEGPPGTPLYYSPERLRAHLGLLPPGAPHGAGPADDVYGLGVTAWRLLTDRYPFLELDEAQRTPERMRGRLPLAPHEVNPRVPPELGARVLRMLAAQPEERPSARELARALEALAHAPEASWEEPLFAWETELSQLGPGSRLRSRVEYELLLARARVEEAHARVAAEVSRVQAPRYSPPVRTARISSRRAGLTVAAAVFLAILVTWPEHAEHEASEEMPGDAGTVGLGDTTLSTPASGSALEPARGDIGLDLPKKPLPGQRRPPCRKPAVEINGGCWGGPIEGESPPCGDQSFAWKDRCYWPFMGHEPPATSEPP